MVAHRADTLARLALAPGERVLDIGSGPGFLAEAMAEAVGPRRRVLGIDISPDFVARAEARRRHGWLSYRQADATAIPERDAAFDVIVSTQVAEYLPDVEAFAREAFRLLRPGGRGTVLATDWGGVVWHAEDPARMARVMRAFEPH